MQSDYKYKSELQNPESKKSVFRITSAWWNSARHQWQRDHQDPEHFQHSAHEHWHVSAQFSCLLVRFVSSSSTHRTALLKIVHVISSMHAMCGSLSTLKTPFPSASSSSHSSFISCTSSTTLSAVASLCTPPTRVWTLLMTPILLTPRKPCIGSKKWRWLIQWMICCFRHQQEVFKCHIFEVLDARIASALNKIIHNSHFKRRVILEEQKAQKQDRFLRGQTDCLPDLRVLPGHRNQRFCRDQCRPIHYCSSIWWYSGIQFKVGWNFDCFWRKSHLMTSWKDCDKLRLRESEKLKTVLELYDLEIHQKKIGPDYHRLKTMVKRSIEQDIKK